jgi:hypothetical protein
MDAVATTRWADIRIRPAGIVRGRTLFVFAACAAAVAGCAACVTEASAHAVVQAEPALTLLLRAMAGLKALMAAGALAAVCWRLGAAVSLTWLAGYTAAAMAMAAGPGLIASMAYVRSGAVLLHAGLMVTLVMLWRDPAMGARLNEALVRRRAGRRADAA